MKFCIIHLLGIVTLIQFPILAQTLDFTHPQEVCLREKIGLANASSNEFNEFQWDFCEGELLESVQFSSAISVSEIDQAAGIKIVEEEGFYYGFIIDRATNKLFRLDFGASLDNIPTNQSVTLPSSITLSSPQGVTLIEVSDLWYGFIVSSGNNRAFRLDFGSSLTNNPTVEELPFQGHLNNPVEVAVVVEGINYFLFVLNFSANNVVAANLGADITNSIPSTFGITSVSGSSNPYGFSIQKYNDNKWRAIVGSYSNSSFQSLEFNNGLTEPASVKDLTSLLPVINNPVKLSLVNWGDENVLFVMAYGGSIYRVHFERGMGFNSIESSNIMNGVAYGATLPLSLHYNKGSWRAYTLPIGSRSLQTILFSKACDQVSQSYYEGDEPPIIYYSDSSVQDITLRAMRLGMLEKVTKQIQIRNQLAPSVTINGFGLCSNADVNFQSEVDVAAQKYAWSFGDTNTSIEEAPTHRYTFSGQYLVKLEVEAGNSCKNTTEKLIKIFDSPVATFDLPAGLICTNNEFTFTNTTTDSFEGNLTYEWLVDNILKSTARDLNYTFTSVDDKPIKLKVAIPGCFSEQTQSIINVESGPVVGFTYAGKCEDENIIFSNGSSGSISDYEWDFGDGTSSSQQNPLHVFPNPDNYAVSLQVNGTNGCTSTLSKIVDIYSVPQTNFSLDLPPFACNGSLSQFNDLTPPMPDSNIASWAWTFGDPSTGTSLQKNPLYTYSLAGDYSVSLTTTSNFGCSNSIQKTVTIYPSPTAAFSFGPACVNQGTQFTNASNSDIKSWLWSIQSNTYSVKDPVHIFKSAATHTALLTVTGTNNCINQISKNVSVPVPIVADFTSVSTCATKPAVFDEINKGGADPAVSWKWDFGDQGSATGTPAQHVFPSTGNPSVTMSTTRQSGCVYSITKTIPIVEPPKAQFTVFLNAGAAPFPVDFVNTSLRTSSYTWKFGDALNSTSTEFSPSFTYTELGNYTAELSVQNALECTDSYSEIISVVVPQINAAISDFKLEKIPGSDSWNSLVTIENKSNVALINPEVFLDISGNALISEKIMGVIKPNELLSHTFTAAIVPRAVDFACAEIRILSDDNSFDNRQCVNVAEQFTSQPPYPNPANDELILEWISKSSESMEVIIYNASGQAISSRLYSPTIKGLNQVKVDVSLLTAGIYFVSYSVDEKTQNFRFSIIR